MTSVPEQPDDERDDEPAPPGYRWTNVYRSTDRDLEFRFNHRKLESEASYFHRRHLWDLVWRDLLHGAAELMAAEAQPEPTVEPPPEPKPKRRLKPSKLAAFEAQWQAEHGAEGES
jgi:hypothetical protein